MTLRRCAFLVLAMASLIAGCGGGGGGQSPSPDPKPGQYSKWTILLYIDGRNDLAWDAILNLNSLESVGSTSQVAIVAQVAHAKGYDSTTWEGVRRYLVTKDSSPAINSTLMSDLGSNVDMASPQTLQNFIHWGVSQFPADHYALVLWDHGGGWKTQALHVRQAVRSILYDEHSGNEMSLDQLSQALQGSPKFDLIVFDACLMQMIEVGTAIKESGNLMVGSEDNIPSLGQRYAEVLRPLIQSPGMTPQQLGNAFVDQYITKYSRSYSGALEMSVVDLNLLGQLTTAADGLASSIIANMPTVKVEVEAAQASVQYFDFGFGDYSDYKDLVDFSTILTNSGCQEVQTAAQSVLQAASKAVTHEGHYTPGMAKAHGISVYLPTPGPNSWLTRYQATQFAQQTHWDEMIAQY